MKNLDIRMLPLVKSDSSDQQDEPSSPPTIAPIKQMKNVSFDAYNRSMDRRAYQSQQIEVDKKTCHFLKNYYLSDLKKKYERKCSITLEDGVCSIYYHDENDFRLIQADIRKIDFRSLKGPELKNLSAILECSRIKEDLESRGCRLEKFEDKILVEGRNCYKNKLKEVRNWILKHHCHELKSYLFGKELSKKQKDNLECVFLHLDQFKSLINNSISELMSIEPKFVWCGEKYAYSLSFIVLAKAPIDLKQLSRQIHEAITDVQCLTVVTSKPKRDKQVVNQLFRYKPFIELDSKETRLLITYKRSLVNSIDLKEYILQVERELGCVFQTVIFDKSELSADIQEVRKRVEKLGFQIRLDDWKRPKRLSAGLPLGSDRPKLINELITVVNSPSPHKKEVQEPDQRGHSDDESCLFESTIVDDESYQNCFQEQPITNTSTEAEKQESKQDLPLFQSDTSNPTTISVEKREFKREDVTPTPVFLQAYNKIEEPEVEVAILSYPFKLLTLNKYQHFNDDIDIMPLNQAFLRKLSFIQGYFKPGAFDTGKGRCLAVRPCYTLELL